MCWCVWDFATFGRGTPAPIDAPKKLVVRGLYRCARNPMYVGVLAVILGWALFFRDPNLVLYALGIGICFHLFIVLYEQRHLAKEFGRQYEEYCSRVAPWLPGPCGASRPADAVENWSSDVVTADASSQPSADVRAQ